MMVTSTRYQTGSSECSCPVVTLLDFHKPQVEFRGPYYMPDKGDSIEMGYGAIECQPDGPLSCVTEAEQNHLVLKAGLPVMVALFSTLLTKEFLSQYEMEERSQGLSSNAPRSSWMARICELAEAIRLKPKPELPCSRDMASVVKDAVLRSAVAISTLYNSHDDKIKSFMRKVTCKYNDKSATRVDFYTMVVMLALCLFPYLKHRILGDRFNNRTLVILCFDKTLTKHHHWSTLATHIHRHVNRPESRCGVLSDGRDLCDFLPVVATVTLEKYISEASYSSAEDDQMSLSQTSPRGDYSQGARGDQTDARRADCSPLCRKTETETEPLVTRKRRKPCSAGYYGAHDDDGRLEAKVPRVV
ncbi:hypothetical protein D5F01_LYC24197 [Larimichthys crocea]|uniref:Uncharacterized protein n=1 Tax=Larimichthys crocea TaxID=215358 RepID=A0A6G0HFH3_LARCR|nr:hypothetical protein D5F01_LYC24197 [Larimichthys crocea]